MERNTETKTLSYSKGMTNIPSDLLSEDSELLECEGFTTANDGSLKPVQQPKLMVTIPYKLQYVHKGADYKNLIAYDEATNKLYCYLCSEETVGDIKGVQSFAIGSLTDVKSIGNTLVCATSDGLHYLLFKANKYIDLGTELPGPIVTFNSYPTNSTFNKTTVCSLDEMIEQTTRTIEYNEDGTIKDIIDDRYLNTPNKKVYHSHSMSKDKEKYDSTQEAIQGEVMQIVSKIKENNRFCFPFYLRYALRLFDGTYTKISNPIAYFPTVDRNCRFVPCASVNGNWQDADCYSDTNKFWCHLMYTTPLNFTVSFPDTDDLTDWTDIVKDVVVFASDHVMPFHLEKDWSFKDAIEAQGQYYYTVIEDAGSRSDYTSSNVKYSFNRDAIGGSEIPRDVIMPQYKTDKEIIDELLTKTQFFKLFEVSVTDENYINRTVWKECPIKSNVVSTLTSQEQLKVDDYYGWTKIIASKMFAYNRRINIFDLKRMPFKGFNYFVGPIYKQFPNTTRAWTYKCYVHIVSETMDTWVGADSSSYLPEMLDSWIYYPDPNATEMIWRDTDTENITKRIMLHKHTMLNGAYSFQNLPFPSKNRSEIEYDQDDSNQPYVGENNYDTLDSQIFTSVVNNPFVFEASGDNTIGTGKILGIAANTEAVSQGQFGQYPLLVFTTEGIYGMSVNSEGLYSTTYPISREVAEDNSPFVPTDKMVFFTSKKGLMAASGGAVAYMSEQLRGKIANNDLANFADMSFIEFLKDCMIAYDYRDSLLRIYNKNVPYQYIYNMVDKTFSIDNSGKSAQSVVNDYPDNLIQDPNGNIYSLTSKPDINDDDNTYNGSILTRPLKLGGSMILKSLRGIKHLLDTEDGKLSLEIWASNDCKHWCQLHSLKGKGWKYFMFRYTLTGFKAVDSFAGSIVRVQNRREDRM